MQLRVQVAAAQHAVDEVRPIERSDQHQRIAQPQLGDDVAPDALGGGRGEGVERHVREIVAQPPELAVLRAEVVSPLADAVRLVDRDEAHARLLQQPPQRWLPSPTSRSGDTYSRRQRSSRTLASTSSRSCGSSVLFRYDAATPSTRRPST